LTITQLELARTLLASGRRDEAAALLFDASTVAPEGPMYHWLAARAYLEMSQPQLALVAARRAAAENLEPFATAALLSAIYGRLGYTDMARSISTDLIGAPPQPSSLNGSIVILAGLGRGWFDIDRHGRPTMEFGHNNIAAVLHELGIGNELVWTKQLTDSANILSGAGIIVGAMSDPDTTGDDLAVADKLLSAAARPVVNAPAAVARSSRIDIATAALGIDGVIVPQIERLRGKAPTGGEGELLLRPAGAHNGVGVGYFENPAEAARHIDRLPRTTFYSTAYVETRHRDNLRRKARLYWVFGKIYPEHVVISPERILHNARLRASMLSNPQLLDEEAEFLTSHEQSHPQISLLLTRLAETTGLDIFMADLGLMEDGRVVLFEANAAARLILESHLPIEGGPHLAAFSRALRGAIRDGIVARKRETPA
jgi:hypothetical protein